MRNTLNELVADSGIDLRQIPDLVNDALFAGDPTMLVVSQIICSLFVLMTVVLPLSMLRAKPMSIGLIIILMLGGLTILGWLPTYLFIVVILVIAVMLAQKGADWLGG